MVDLSNTLISIIVPIYNVEYYLKRCLDSIIRQTYQNLEIFLIDDGSTDNSSTICDEYKLQDNRIKLIHKTNGGLSDARNAGLNICSGEYITFIDSDDWVSEQYVENLLNLAKSEDADIVVGEHLITSGNTTAGSSDNRYMTYSRNEALQTLYKNKYLSFTVSWGKLYKRELFSDIRFPLHKFHEDTFTTFLLFHKSKRIIHTNEILYYYYQRSNSITSIDHPHDALESIELQYHFFKEEEQQTIYNLILPQLCWQCLYVVWTDYKGKHGEYSTSLQKLRNYTKELSFFHTNILHFFFLQLFSNFPKSYFIFRKHSPIHVRKERNR